MQFTNIPPMIKRCILLYKPADNGSITSLGRRQSSILITSLCNSCKHRENYKMTVIRSGPHICSNSTSTLSTRKGSTNRVVDCLSRPPVAALTMVLNSCCHETSEWSQLYSSDSDFATTYQLLVAGTPIADFYLHDGLHVGPPDHQAWQ